MANGSNKMAAYGYQAAISGRISGPLLVLNLFRTSKKCVCFCLAIGWCDMPTANKTVILG